MDLESSLRARRSLVWETRDISKYQKDSPVFSLIDSNWILQINPVYAVGSFFPTSYNIKLKNCSEIQSFQPFEVVTFLVDRRSNAQMHCSKLTVSTACEILFKSSFDSTYEKLPGLKLYDDVAIMCTFYPSTGLALSMNTVKGSSLRIRHSIVWKTGKPKLYQNRESAVFNLKDSKWKLELLLGNSPQYRSSVYQIYLRNISGLQSFQPFDIETFIVDRKNFVQILCSKLTVSSTSEILHKASIDSIYEELSGLKNSDEITVVCVFGPPIGSGLGEKMENDVTVSMECSRCRIQDNFALENGTKISSSNPSQVSKFIPNFEDLSKDLGFLLQKSFMSDIQLKCGEDVIPAHKAVLAARSSVFSEMLKSEMVECINVVVEIKDIEPSVFRELLRYLYSGEISVELPEDMLFKLYTASNNYSVQSLRKLCSCVIAKNLNTDNFMKVLILADEHNDQEMVDAVASFIRERPELLLSDIWVSFSEEFPRLANEIYRKHMATALKICALK